MNVYRIGPIAAFKKNAHSVSQILNSYFFAKYGIPSYIYLRNTQNNSNNFYKFYGIEPVEKFYIKLSSKNKTISSLQNYTRLFLDILKNKSHKNYIYLSKPKHVILLSKFKRILKFKIIYENHTDKLNISAVNNADLIYVVSPYVYKQLKHKNNVIFWDYHYPLSEKFFDIEKNCISEKKNFILGYIGSLIKEKGIDILIELFNNFPMDKFKLKIIGGKEGEINQIKKDLKSSNVFFTGFLSQNKIIEELKDIDILIAPFTKMQTTIPLKIYEYMASGIPIIASGIDSVKKVAKEYIFYFEPENVNSLFKVLNYVAENYHLAFEKALISKKFAEKFKWNNAVKKMINDLEYID